jgi:alkanesulfonate monooxygenase SsuD/methylene tetrahydromethanopterin reductase-like flavin-dependent oxidoreductase (luciferase family)
VRVGIMLGDAEKSMTSREHFELVLRQVEAAQRNGIKYICLGQHFGYPDYRWFQPVPMLARLSSELDESVRLVTTILIAPLYHPLLLAEELATVDVISNGRLVVGLSIGYLNEEFKAFGISRGERVARLEESVDLMKRIWTEPRVTHDGAFWSLDDVPQHIAPVQDPRPPIWIGAHSEMGVRRAARIGDAWLPPPKLAGNQYINFLDTFISTRESLGLETGSLPIRKEISIGRDRQEAIDAYTSRVEGRYLHQVQHGITEISGITEKDVTDDMAQFADSHVIAGSAVECFDQIRDISMLMRGRGVRADPIITRATWPGMDSSGAVAYIDGLGKELVPALAEFE